MKENEWTTCQDAQNVAKVELRGEFIAVNVYIQNYKKNTN